MLKIKILYGIKKLNILIIFKKDLFNDIFKKIKYFNEIKNFIF